MNKKIILGLIALVFGGAVFLNLTRSNASEWDYVYDGAPEIIAATFAAEWCSSCKIIEPRLADVAPEFKDAPVKFVELDFTFGANRELAEKADAVGLGGIYPQFKGATGFTLLVDAETGVIIDRLTMNHSPAAMRTAIAQAVAFAQNAE